MTEKIKALAFAVVLAGAGQANAADHLVSLTGTTSTFSENTNTSGGFTYDDFYLALGGLDSSNAFTVAQGDTITSTVTFDTAYTLPASHMHTDFLQYFTGSSFPSENTGVSGTFTLFDAGSQVATFNYGSTTSDALSSYAALFPPNNGAVTFDSFTNDLTVTYLPTPATIDGSAFDYTLVSAAVPEPASWALMLAGFGMIGGMARRRPARAAI